jgi:hypothetical protein
MYGGRSKLTHLTPIAPTFSMKAAVPPVVGARGQMQRHRRGGCLMPSRANIIDHGGEGKSSKL